MGLLDYSLIVGFSAGRIKNARRMSGAEKAIVGHVWGLPLDHDPEDESDGTMRIAYVGIIDILMEYNWFKKIENWFMTRLMGQDISCQPPPVYATRFGDFVAHITCVGRYIRFTSLIAECISSRFVPTRYT